jgi:cation diffusion facilitator family transporter
MHPTADAERTHAHAVGLAANLGLAVGKLVVGTLAGSTVLVADGLNSTGDVVATAIGWVGFRLGRRPADDDHPFGHGGFEAVAGLVIGAVLLMTGVFVTVDGVRALLRGPTDAPGSGALVAAVVTAVVKEGLYRYTVAEGRRLNSPALKASARDHRADVGLAFVVFGAVAGARIGWPLLDPLAACLVGVWIVGMAYEPLRSNLGVLLDEAPEGVADAVRAVVLDVHGVRSVGAVEVHPLGSYHVVTIEVGCDGEATLADADRVAEAVVQAVRERVDHVGEVRVRPRPADARHGRLLVDEPSDSADSFGAG